MFRSTVPRPELRSRTKDLMHILFSQSMTTAHENELAKFDAVFLWRGMRIPRMTETYAGELRECFEAEVVEIIKSC
jgi:hypothetical protein